MFEDPLYPDNKVRALRTAQLGFDCISLGIQLANSRPKLDMALYSASANLYDIYKDVGYESKLVVTSFDDGDGWRYTNLMIDRLAPIITIPIVEKTNLAMERWYWSTIPRDSEYVRRSIDEAFSIVQDMETSPIPPHDVMWRRDILVRPIEERLPEVGHSVSIDWSHIVPLRKDAERINNFIDRFDELDAHSEVSSESQARLLLEEYFTKNENGRIYHPEEYAEADEYIIARALGIPKWLKGVQVINQIASYAIVVATLDLVFSAIRGEVRRTRLKELIRDSIEPRIQLRMLVDVCYQTTVTMNAITETSRAMKSVKSITKSQIDDAIDKINKDHEKRLAMVTHESAKSELELEDTLRNAWVEDDY
jgi:hypothetical protein